MLRALINDVKGLSLPFLLPWYLGRDENHSKMEVDSIDRRPFEKSSLVDVDHLKTAIWLTLII